MKIIVDEMPKSAEDCVFGTGEDEKRCVINNRDYCYNSKNCEYLKPITDFHAEEIVEKYKDGSYLARGLNIKQKF